MNSNNEPIAASARPSTRTTPSRVLMTLPRFDDDSISPLPANDAVINASNDSNDIDDDDGVVIVVQAEKSGGDVVDDDDDDGGGVALDDDDRNCPQRGSNSRLCPYATTSAMHGCFCSIILIPLPTHVFVLHDNNDCLLVNRRCDADVFPMLIPVVVVAVVMIGVEDDDDDEDAIDVVERPTIAPTQRNMTAHSVC
jgi:hypothetical protein